MNCRKNKLYKSTVETYNNAGQTLTSTPTPLTLIGIVVTDTGIAITPQPNSIELGYSGTYELNAAINLKITTAGAVFIALYNNGVLLPDTVRTETFAAGNGSMNTETIRTINVSCDNTAVIQLYAWTDGTAEANVSDAVFISAKMA